MVNIWLEYLKNINAENVNTIDYKIYVSPFYLNANGINISLLNTCRSHIYMLHNLYQTLFYLIELLTTL